MEFVSLNVKYLNQTRVFLQTNSTELSTLCYVCMYSVYVLYVLNVNSIFGKSRLHTSTAGALSETPHIYDICTKRSTSVARLGIIGAPVMQLDYQLLTY